MSLLQTETTKTNAPAFEDDDAAITTATPANTAASVASTAAVAGIITPQPVALVQKQAVAVMPTAMPNVLDQYKNALRVEYNTLEAVITTNGNFVSRESKKVLGDTVTFELLSFQDSYVVSPNDDKAPDDVVRYSDDGLTCSDGTAVQEHLHWLRTSGYPKAALKQRVVVVGALLTTAKPVGMEGTLVQFDLSPVSRTHWLRYTANSAYGLKIGKYTLEQLQKVSAAAELATSGTNTYTFAKFSVA